MQTHRHHWSSDGWAIIACTMCHSVRWLNSGQMWLVSKLLATQPPLRLWYVNYLTCFSFTTKVSDYLFLGWWSHWMIASRIIMQFSFFSDSFRVFLILHPDFCGLYFLYNAYCIILPHCYCICLFTLCQFPISVIS